MKNTMNEMVMNEQELNQIVGGFTVVEPANEIFEDERIQKIIKSAKSFWDYVKKNL